MALESPPCVGWETTVPEYQTARAGWTEPACYTFQYTFLGFTVGPRVPRIRQVVNGAAVDAATPDEPYQTIQSFFDLIENHCVRNCPESGAHKCIIRYNTTETGLIYPESVYIDVQKFMADDEHVYRLENVQIQDCQARGGGGNPTGDIVREPETEQEQENTLLEEEVCIDYQNVLAHWQNAVNIWNEPNCYTYTINRLGRLTQEYAGPFEIAVNHGKATLVSGFAGAAMDITLTQWFDTIFEQCLKGCHTGNVEDAAYMCDIEYDKTYGFPTLITIDPSRFTVDEELYYVMSNFKISPSCSQEPETQPEKESTTRCVNYEAIKAQLDEARELWTKPTCYDFQLSTIQELSTKGAEVSSSVQVRNGIELSDVGVIDGDVSIDDLFAKVEDLCVTRCESETNQGAAYQCQFDYDTITGVPTWIRMDYDIMSVREEAFYRISDFAVVECDTKCIGYETLMNNLQTARSTWSNITCYDFTFERQFGEQQDVLHTVQVRDGTVVSGDNDEWTVPDLYNLIYESCIKDCRNGSIDTAHNCKVAFDDDTGLPNWIEIDSGVTEQDGEVYRISNLVEADCAQPLETCSRYNTRLEQLENAKEIWTQSNNGCYVYTWEQSDGMQIQNGPYSIVVRDNQVIDSGGSPMTETVDSLFEKIQEECFTGCPKPQDTGATRCTILYSPHGYPLLLYMKYELEAFKEEISWSISKLEHTDCSSLSTPIERGDPTSSAVRNSLPISAALWLSALLTAMIFN